MRVLMFCVMLFTTGIHAAAQTNSGVIAGKVARPGGEGISGVDVLLVGPLTGPAANAAASNPLMIAEIAEGASVSQANLTTDNDGRFLFRNLAPGQYTVRVRREGYTSATPDMIGGFPSLVTAPAAVVARTATPELNFTLRQGGTVSGRIRDANGQPASSLTVTAYQVGYRDGREALNPVSSRQTDDRGDYRLYWLPPGPYYVAVTQGRPGAGAQSPLPGFRQDASGIRTFYPSVADVRSAQSLAVTEGADMSGIDINMGPTDTFKVSGRIVSTLPGGNALPQGSLELYLLPQDSGLVTDTATPSYQNYATNPGEFEIRGVPPGSYDLVATAPDSRGRPYPGRVRIDVGSQDLEGVTLSIHPGAEVKVRVFVDGRLVPAQLPVAPVAGTPPSPPAPPLTPGGVSVVGGPISRVNLRSRGGFPMPFDTAASNVTSDSSGAYVFPSIPEGLYTVTVGGVPQNSYVADIREGAASVYDSGLAVGERGQAVVDVFVSSGAQSIRGTVRNAEGKPAVSATVVVAPPPARRQNPSLFRTSRTNFNGEFLLNNVPPGEYKLFAFESIPNTAYMNAAYMEKYESRGREVTLTPGADSNFELVVISNDPRR